MRREHGPSAAPTIWCLSDGFLLSNLMMMIHFFSFLILTPTVTARIVGFHVDDETCSGLLMNNRTLQVYLCFWNEGINENCLWHSTVVWSASVAYAQYNFARHVFETEGIMMVHKCDPLTDTWSSMQEIACAKYFASLVNLSNTLRYERTLDALNSHIATQPRSHTTR